MLGHMVGRHYMGPSYMGPLSHHHQWYEDLDNGLQDAAMVNYGYDQCRHWYTLMLSVWGANRQLMPKPEGFLQLQDSCIS